MIFFFYNLALLVALVVGAPWWLWRMATTHKYREGLLERLGRVPRRLATVFAPAGERPLIWLHAVSVGEVLAITRLVKDPRGRAARLPDRHLHHHPHRPGAGPRALRLEPRLLLPARSALGRPRLSERPQAAPARSWPKPNSGPTCSAAASAAESPLPSSMRASPTAPGRATGACASLWRPLLSPPQPRACPEPDRRRPPARARLPSRIASPSPAISNSMCARRRKPMPRAC